MNEFAGQVDVLDLLADRLEIRNVHPASGGTEANFSCPFAGHAHGDERPSAYMNMESTAWFCWGCKERGRDAVSFVAKVLNIEYTQAQSFLRELYGITFREPIDGSMRGEIERRFADPPELPELRKPAPTWQETFVYDLFSSAGNQATEYLASRGFNSETAKDWGFGYDAMSDRLTLPVYDVEGGLVGFKGRALGDDRDPKYLVLGDRDPERSRYGFDPYEASQVVFGLHRNRGHRRGVLCEGELDPSALAQLGVQRPVGLGMSYLSEAAAALLVQELEELVVFFDTDLAGGGGIWGHVQEKTGSRLPGLVEKLEPFIIVRIVPDHEGDPAKMLQEGRGSEALALIDAARSSVAMSITSR